jgi:hypothetical protein
MIMKCLWSALALSLSLTTAAAAQTDTSTTGQQRVTTRLVVGSSTFDQVLKVVGLPSVSGGASSAIGIDSSGNVRKDSGTTISTGGAWTLGGPATTFTNGALGPFRVSGGSAADAALGSKNIRFHVNGSARMTLEDTSFPQWNLDNLGGVARLFRTNSAGTADETPIALGDNIVFDPLGHVIMPALPGGFDIGTFTLPIGTLHVNELWATSFVAQETIATIGGSIEVAPTTTLIEAINSSSTTIKTKQNNLAVGARAYLKADFRQEMLGVTAGPTKINTCSVNCDADSATNWAGFGGTLALAPNIHMQGQYSILYTPTGGPPNTIAHTTVGDFAASTQYTISLFIRRSDATAVIPSGSAYRFLCGDGVTIWNATGVIDVGSGWYRVWATCTSPASPTGVFGVTGIPTGGGLTHFFDAVQIEAGAVLTSWSLSSASYTVTRDLDSSGANSWDAGAAVVDTTLSFIDIYSTHGIKSSSEIGPTMCGNVRQSSTWNDWAPRWCIGQLNGLYGYATSTFGAAFGDPTATHIDITTTNGYRVMSGANTRLQFDASGNGFLVGTLTMNSSVAAIIMDSTAQFRTSSDSSFGTGTGFFMTGNGGSPQFRVGNCSANHCLSYDGTFSQFQILADNISITSGIKISPSTSSTPDFTRAISWTTPLADPFIYAYGTSTNQQLQIVAQAGDSTHASSVYIEGSRQGVGVGANYSSVTVADTGIAFSTGQTFSIDGNIGGSTGGSVTCPAGQALKTVTVYKGIIVSIACGVP